MEKLFESLAYADLATCLLLMGIFSILLFAAIILQHNQLTDLRTAFNTEKLFSQRQGKLIKDINLEIESLAKSNAQRMNDVKLLTEGQEHLIKMQLANSSEISQFKNSLENEKQIISVLENRTEAEVAQLKADIDRLKKGKANKISIAERKAARK